MFILCVSSALQCENGLVYEACGPACSPECPSALSTPETLCSALSCVEGCFCPHGTVRHGKRCVCVFTLFNVCFHLSDCSFHHLVFFCISSAGEGCISLSQCPCELDGSLYPAGASVVQHCQNWSVWIRFHIYSHLVVFSHADSCALCSAAHVPTAPGIVRDLHVLLRLPVRIQSFSVRVDPSAVFHLSGSVITKTTAAMVLMRSVRPRALRVTSDAPGVPACRWSSGVTDTPTAPTNQTRTSVHLPHRYLSVQPESSCAQTDAVYLRGKSVMGSWIVDLRMILMSTVCLFTYRRISVLISTYIETFQSKACYLFMCFRLWCAVQTR